MALAATLIVLVTTSLSQQARTIRREKTEIILDQLIDSALSWANAHPDICQTTKAIHLDPSNILPPESSGKITIETAVGWALPTLPGRHAISITAELNIHDRRFKRVSLFPCLPPSR